MVRKSSVCLLAGCLFLASAELPVRAGERPFIQQDKSDGGAEKIDLAPHLESFDLVWETVRNAHWDYASIEKDWMQARDTLRPRIEAAKNIGDVRDVIEELLAVPKQSHFGLIPQGEYQDLNEAGGSGGDGEIGMSIRLIEGELVVTQVRPGFPAAEAGIVPGWVLRQVGSKSSDDILKAATDAESHSVMKSSTVVGLVCDSLLSGPPGEETTLKMLDLEDQARDLTLAHATSPGVREIFGNLPPFLVNYEDRMLDGDIGYIHFNAFLGGPRLSTAFRESIGRFQNAKGLVIDLRGNRGGIILLVAGMCGRLTAQRAVLGEMKLSGKSRLNPRTNPQKPSFHGPIAVLIDECSISSAEIMSGGLKDLKVARVFGNTTAGLALPSVVAKLPNGDRFQYAIASWKSASGDTLEGEGVKPDQVIPLTRELLARDPDPVLTAATTWIREQPAQDSANKAP